MASRAPVVSPTEIIWQTMGGKTLLSVSGSAIVWPPAMLARAFAMARSERELRTAAVIALRQVAGGVRRQLAAFATLAFATVGALLLLFPRVMSITFAVGAFWLALGFAWYVVARRRWRVGDDVP